MALSYLSTPFKSSPYVLPLDLGLFSNVMSIKQKKIDDNVKATQAGIDQLGLLDVIKDEDKQYLNEKINGIVSTINNFGGVDFSDANVMNQIEGLGNDVYGDDKVLSAISSTRGIRKLQDSYEKYKTDPKLNKLYSEVNESYDMQGVQSYLNDKTVGSKYSGPTSPTPYTAYRDNHIKAFEKVKADLNVQLTDNGLYYSSTTNEYIHPERIMSMAADLLTPQERAQMKRDGWYLFRGAAPEQLLQKGVQQFTAKKQDAEALLRQYEQMAASAVSDPQARKRYNILADNQAKVLSSIVESENSFGSSFANRLKDNPEELYYELYSNDYFRGLGNRFSYNKTSRAIIPNTAEMFKQKMKQADQQFRETMDLSNNKFGFEQQKHEDEMSLEYLKLGKYRRVDPITGKVEVLDLPGGNGHLITDTPNIEDPDNLKVTEKTLTDINTELKIENDKLSQDFISRVVALHPELGEELQSNLGKGITRKLKGQDAIENFNGIPGFQVDDLRMFETTTNADGKPIYKNESAVQRYGHIAGINSKQLEFFSNQWKNYESLALGKGNGTPDLIDGFPETVEKMVLNNEKINANTTKLANVRGQVYDELGLTSEQAEYVEKNYIRVTGQPFGLEGLLNFISEKFSNTFSTSNKEKVKKAIDKKLSVLATRDVYGVRTLSDNEMKSGDLNRYVVQQIADNKSEVYGDSGEVSAGDVTETNVKSRMIGKASDGTGRWMILSDIVTGSGEKQKVARYKTYLSDENAEKFGLKSDPYEAINYSVAVNGRTGDIPVYGSKDLATFINVTAYNTNDLNDKSSLAQVKVYYLDENGQKTGRYDTIKIPATEGRTPSESYQLAKKAIQEAGKLGLKNEDFIEYLRNFKNR
jgi:hypothetical protein